MRCQLSQFNMSVNVDTEGMGFQEAKVFAQSQPKVITGLDFPCVGCSS